MKLSFFALRLKAMNRPRRTQCCMCWREGIPPTWLVVCGALFVQAGERAKCSRRLSVCRLALGYPVVVKEFAYSTTGEAWGDGSRFCGNGHAPASALE